MKRTTIERCSAGRRITTPYAVVEVILNLARCPRDGHVGSDCETHSLPWMDR